MSKGVITITIGNPTIEIIEEDTTLSQHNRIAREHKGKSVIKLLQDYTIIDIETTGLSPEYDEIIELAAIRVRNNTITETFSSLVQPTFEIDEFITELTGITNEMLEDAPDISSALPKFIDFIADDILIGHNVNFDINFLYDNAKQHLDQHLSNDFIDTMRIFRKLHAELKHHRLKDLSALYKLDYSNAHRSLNDCKLTLSAYNSLLNEVHNRFSTEQEFIDLFKQHKSKTKASDITATTTDIDEDNLIFGNTFVFTGVLERMSRKEAMQIVVNHGGINGDNVTKKTNYLVLGNNDYCKSIKDGKSTKHKKAEQLKPSGQDIEIISESVFYDMIKN